MFADRRDELAFLDGLLGRDRAQLVLLYGRRRVGKSRLLAHWAETRALDVAYFTAERDPPELQRAKLAALLTGLPVASAPASGSWGELFGLLGPFLREKPRVVVIDELPYLIESDVAVLSALQSAWDRQISKTRTKLVLCGSHVRTMEGLMARSSPLFGRMTGQWKLESLPFGALAEFFPKWSMEERVEAHAIVGGVPAYLEWLDPSLGLRDNLREVVLAAGSLFTAEPMLLLYDEVRDPRNYLAVLAALGAGAHELDAIARATRIDKKHLSAYLARLQELRLVERRVPATLTPAAARRSRRGRYHLLDAYLRFYFRFVAGRRLATPGDREALRRSVLDGLEPFTGATAFEELAHRWVDSPAGRDAFPHRPDQVGRFWDRGAQADLVAPSFTERAVLIGECRWTSSPVERDEVERLFEHTGPAVLAALETKGRRFSVRHVVFAKRGLTRGARETLKRRGGIAVDLRALEAALRLPG